MKDILHILADGLANGLLLAPLACAFAVVHNHAHIFHFALAGIFTATPYVAWLAVEKGFSLGIAFLISIAAGVSLSWFCDLFNHRLLRRRSASPGAHLITSLGISIIMMEMVVVIFGAEVKFLRNSVAQPVAWTFGLWNESQVTTSLLIVATLIAYFLWLKLTSLGLKLRALADDSTELGMRGFRVEGLYAGAFALSGGLASVAAFGSAYDLRIEPNSGLPSLLLSVAAMILGHRKSITGPIFGALGLGVILAFVDWYSRGEWSSAAAYLTLAIILIFYPRGLGSRKERLEESPE